MSKIGWVALLPEVGDPILRDLEGILSIEMQIKALEEVKQNREKVVLEVVQERWSTEEQANAQVRYLTILSGAHK